MKSIRISALSLLALTGAAAACGAPPSTESVGSTGQAVTGPAHAAQLLLTSTVLARLQARAAANDPAWTALKTHCDGLVTGTANVPTGNAYPNFPDVGQGYEGDGYAPEVLNLGLCYQTIYPTNPTTAAGYAAAGDRILVAMSTPAASGGQAPSTDDGYGIRNYGVGMAFGFDWMYSGLQASTRAAVITALNSWVSWYDASGFSNTAPVGNYFAGYILAKTATAIATAPDNASAAGYWSAVQTTQFPQLIQAIYAPSMKGGGWPEGWEYGPLAVENYALFFWAVKTGKGLDWFDQIPSTHDEAAYMRYFTWPSLKHMDDQGTIHSGVAMTPSGMAASAMATMLAANGDSTAPAAQELASTLIATNDDSLFPWQGFLYRDPAQAATAYTAQPLSYFASGPSYVAARSTWSTDAVWGAFSPGAYIDSTDSGEQLYNSGAISIVSGDTPIVCNATGQLPQVDGTAGENLVYADSYDGGQRQLFNTFGATGIMQAAEGPSVAATHAINYEDNGTFVHARGVQLEQMYTPSGVVSQWTRDFAYVRPGVFVVLDRATTNAADNWVSWHTEVAPTSVATSDATTSRFDVTGGSLHMLLPKSATVKTVPIAAGITRLETHSSNPSDTWLTVITAGATPNEVRLSNADGNVTAGSLVGANVLGARNAVVLFNADHAAAQTTTSATYTVTPTAVADHILFDMASCSTGYAVTTGVSGDAITVKVTQGGSFKASADGTLAFVVSTSGAVTASTTSSSGSSSSSSGSSSGGSSSGSSSSGSSSSGSSSSGSSSSGSSSGGSSSGGSSSSGSSSGGSSSGSSSGGSTSGSTGIVVPAGGEANLLSDPGFETDTCGFEVWPGGTKAALTTDAIDGNASGELVLPAGSYAIASVDAQGTGVAHATARLRNDGAAAATIRFCVGIYDQSWNSQLACTDYTLAPGVVTEVSAAYALPSGTTAQMTNWEIAPTSGSAQLAIDDAYLGYAAE